MFGHKDKEHSASSISEYIDKKSQLIKKKNRIFRSKINYALHGQHKHYFSKQDVLSQKENAQCKVCKMTLSEYRVQKRIDNWTPHLKPIHKTTAATENQAKLD
jgi:hypothetical protein